jgi:hypothetical protein
VNIGVSDPLAVTLTVFPCSRNGTSKRSAVPMIASTERLRRRDYVQNFFQTNDGAHVIFCKVSLLADCISELLTNRSSLSFSAPSFTSEESQKVEHLTRIDCDKNNRLNFEGIVLPRPLVDSDQEIP